MKSWVEAAAAGLDLVPLRRARRAGGLRLEPPPRRLREDPALSSLRRAFVATSVFVFVTTWNEYVFASVMLSDQSNQTLTVWLSYFYGTSRNTDLGGFMAASTLIAIPVVIFFLLVERRIAFGLTAGAVRG